MHSDATADLNEPGAESDPHNGALAPGAPVGADYQDLDVPGCTLISVLGSGGMGVVFLARQERLQRLVAVKMLSTDAAQDARYLERLEREAQTLATLSHPNIVGCHDIVSTDQGTFLIMEFVPGQLSVRDLLSRFRRLPEDLVARIALDVSRGLAYAQVKGITHHDVKPDNLLVYRDSNAPPHSPEEVLATPHARIMICDFGIARERRADEQEESKILGTPAYMAPEQAFELDHADFRADIYALGSTLYHLLTGERPFAGESSMDTVEMKRWRDLPSPRTAGVSVSDECVYVLKRMGATAPDARYASYADLLVDLERWAKTHEIERHHSIFGRYPPSFWRGLLAGLCVVVALVFLGWAALALTQVFTPEPVSRAATLGYWDGDRSAWYVAAADSETQAPALTGLPVESELRLKQVLTTDYRVRLSVRLPGEGAVRVMIEDEGGQRWKLVWRRQDGKSSFSSTADGRDIPLVSIPERAPLQWLPVDIRPSTQQIDLHADGRLRAVAPLKQPLATFRLVLDVVDGSPAQFKEVFITERD